MTWFEVGFESMLRYVHDGKRQMAVTKNEYENACSSDIARSQCNIGKYNARLKLANRFETRSLAPRD